VELNVPTGTYVVECFWPGVSDEGFLAASLRADECAADLRLQGRQVRLVASILLLEDETVFCVFQGDLDVVRDAASRAQLPFERVLASVTFGRV
jgi:hypothetical protein